MTMSQKLYNSRTRRLEPFEPINPPNVRIYVCGLTPSAEAHIGHFRTYLFFDVLRRYLTHLGYHVTYVQNVTDIDDRSIARGIQTGENWHEIVLSYYASFKGSWEKLDLLPIEPSFEPYATRYIPQIITMIGDLVRLEYAYAAKDGVYYRVAKFPDYGKLSNRNIGELRAGARIEVDEFKEDPLDFALWKFAKPGEPHWSSPWGEGRPGWHIECSAMARELLGETFDIHGGGADLIFPHHENEIAQSVPLMDHPGPPMANHWVHGGLLLFENKKMSKSLGNFEPVFELLKRHDPQAIRLLFLQTGYSKVMNFTEDSIAAAGASLEKLKSAYRQLAAAQDVVQLENEGPLIDAIEAALDEDMNTAAALAALHHFASEPFPTDAKQRAGAAGQYAYALELLGLKPKKEWLAVIRAELPANFLECLQDALGEAMSVDGMTPEAAISEVIHLRAQARANKNFSESDRLRDVLANCGVILKDSKEGTTWTAGA